MFRNVRPEIGRNGDRPDFGRNLKNSNFFFPANSPPIYLDLVVIHFFGGVEYKKVVGRDVFF